MIDNPRPVKINETDARIISTSLVSQLTEKIDAMIKDGLGDRSISEIIPLEQVSMANSTLYTTIVGTNQPMEYHVMIVTGTKYKDSSLRLSIMEGGIFSDVQKGIGEIVIELNSDRTPNQIKVDLSLKIPNRVYSILIHEYTHAREYKHKDTFEERAKEYNRIVREGDFGDYVNIPEEMKAHQQEIINEVLEKLKRYPTTFKWFNTKPFDVALRMTSPLYRDIELDLNEENKYQTFQTVYQALIENGFVFKRKHVKSNPDYQDGHRPASPDYGSPLYDLTLNGTYPDDVYSNKGRRYYGDIHNQDAKAWKMLHRCHHNPECKVTIYRTIPKSVPSSQQKIYTGDWVSLDLRYVIDHAERLFEENNYVVLSAKVKAKELWTDGNSLSEWGWWSANNMPSAIGSDDPMSKSLIAKHLKFNPQVGKEMNARKNGTSRKEHLSRKVGKEEEAFYSGDGEYHIFIEGNSPNRQTVGLYVKQPSGSFLYTFGNSGKTTKKEGLDQLREKVLDAEHSARYNHLDYGKMLNLIEEVKHKIDQPRTNGKKSSIGAEERFKRWHWGIDATHQLQIDDDRFPDEMIEIGRLMELRMVRPEIDRSNPKYSDLMSIEIDEDSINECYVVFDHNHSKDRIYFLLNPQTQKDFKKIYDELDDKPILMNDLAIHGGGHHGDMKDYPNEYVKPFAYLTDVVYYTHKKGDDDGIGSGYVHKMGEEGGTEPIIGIAEDGTIWMLGGSYTCPYAGITN